MILHQCCCLYYCMAEQVSATAWQIKLVLQAVLYNVRVHVIGIYVIYSHMVVYYQVLGP